MIKIICVGSLKEKYWIDAVLEYQKRLQKYKRIELIEVADTFIDDVSVALRKEEERILKVLSPKDFLITLEIEGQQFSSIEFSSLLTNLEIHHPNITFLIGGSFGLSDTIKKRSNLRLSFSSMTFPHQLFRVMLLEQIYRACRIQSGETYHK